VRVFGSAYPVSIWCRSSEVGRRGVQEGEILSSRDFVQFE